MLMEGNSRLTPIKNVSPVLNNAFYLVHFLHKISIRAPARLVLYQISNSLAGYGPINNNLSLMIRG